MKPALRLGTRGSALALAQAEAISAALGGLEIVTIETSGDRGEGGDKARFVKEIEEALLDEEVDLAVHSAKDLPIEIPGGLALVGVSEREDPADAYCGAAGSLAAVAAGARIGTSSLRRTAQLRAIRDDIEIVPVRGNVDTRLRKLEGPGLDGIVLAAAGLRRLGREDAIAFRFGEEEMTPAAGQGALALEARAGDKRAAAAAATITDEAALLELTAERAAVGALGATCNTPVGLRAHAARDRMTLDGFVGMPDGSRWVRDSLWGDPGQPGSLGLELAEQLLNAGAANVLKQAEAMA
ncbi:MAG TPA: hydroxymethylbilane synthase [Solirubrobacterales bacterium]